MDVTEVVIRGNLILEMSLRPLCSRAQKNLNRSQPIFVQSSAVRSPVNVGVSSQIIPSPRFPFPSVNNKNTWLASSSSQHLFIHCRSVVHIAHAELNISIARSPCAPVVNGSRQNRKTGRHVCGDSSRTRRRTDGSLVKEGSQYVKDEVTSVIWSPTTPLEFVTGCEYCSICVWGIVSTRMQMTGE